MMLLVFMTIRLRFYPMSNQDQNHNQQAYSWRQTWLPFLSLFTSMGTLLCCALPALLVTLGLGASLAGFVSSAPWLVALSEHKVALFIGAGLLLGGAAYMQWRARYAPCPVDPDQARACMRLRKMSLILLWLSIVIYAIGGFFAFIAQYVLL